MVKDLQDRVHGCLLGTAQGDAIGMPVEGLTRGRIKELFGKISKPEESCSEYTRGLARNHWTDDTKHSLATAEGFILARSSDFQVIVPRVLERYTESLIEHKRGFGRTTRESLEDRKLGLDPFDGRHPIRPGNGCSMRSAIVGLWSHIVYGSYSPAYGNNRVFDFERLIIQISQLTHIDPRSVTAGGAQALAAWMIADGKDLRDVFVFSIFVSGVRSIEARLLSRVEPELSSILAQTLAYSKKSEDEIINFFGTSGTVYESFPTAFTFTLKYFDEYRAGVLAGANAGGDTDTIAAMTGALLGARLGVDAIPPEWLQDLEAKGDIMGVADQFLKTALYVQGELQSKKKYYI